jgi:hypothetical protein
MARSSSASASSSSSVSPTSRRTCTSVRPFFSATRGAASRSAATARHRLCGAPRRRFLLGLGDSSIRRRLAASASFAAFVLRASAFHLRPRAASPVGPVGVGLSGVRSSSPLRRSWQGEGGRYRVAVAESKVHDCEGPDLSPNQPPSEHEESCEPPTADASSVPISTTFRRRAQRPDPPASRGELVLLSAPRIRAQ